MTLPLLVPFLSQGIQTPNRHMAPSKPGKLEGPGGGCQSRSRMKQAPVQESCPAGASRSSGVREMLIVGGVVLCVVLEPRGGQGGISAEWVAWVVQVWFPGGH